MPYIGEIAAILAALSWAVGTAIFEDLGKRASALSMNFYKAFFAFFYFLVFIIVTKGGFVLSDVGMDAVMWLSLSGLFGLVIGDFFLLEAIVLMGAKIVLLIYVFSPPMSGILAYFILGQNMTLFQNIGMVVTLTGVSAVIFNMDRDDEQIRIRVNYPLKGIIYAVLGSFMQALGYVVGKLGLDNIPAIEASFIRTTVAVIGLAIIVIIRGKTKSSIGLFKEKTFFSKMAIGAFFGGFFGTTFLLLGAQYTAAGVASTLSALSPIMILPISYFVKKQALSIREVVGAVVGVVGVAFMFL